MQDAHSLWDCETLFSPLHACSVQAAVHLSRVTRPRIRSGINTPFLGEHWHYTRKVGHGSTTVISVQ